MKGSERSKEMSDKIITKQQVEEAEKKVMEMKQKLQLQTEKKILKICYDYCKKNHITLEEMEPKLRDKLNEPQLQA